jgi:hypothetical protein
MPLTEDLAIGFESLRDQRIGLVQLASIDQASNETVVEHRQLGRPRFAEDLLVEGERLAN